VRQAAALRRLAAGFHGSGIFDKVGLSEVVNILRHWRAGMVRKGSRVQVPVSAQAQKKIKKNLWQKRKNQ